VSAKDIHAYPDAPMHRTLVLLKDESFRNPILIDVFRVESEMENQYDLPLWFHGHLLDASFDYAAQMQRMTTLGNGHGYQHIWEEANGKTSGKSNHITWFAHQHSGGGQMKGKLFTMTTSSENNDELIFARAGANDPKFNLRHDPVFIQRRKAKNSVFASVIESHGTYDPVSEIPSSPFSEIKSVEVIHDSKEYTVVRITHNSNKIWTLAIANKDASEKKNHEVKLKGETLNWQGPFSLK